MTRKRPIREPANFTRKISSAQPSSQQSSLAEDLTQEPVFWYYPYASEEATKSLPGAPTIQEPWCSGLTCLPVTQKIAGSNPVGSADATVM